MTAQEVQARVADQVKRVQQVYSRWRRDTSAMQMRQDWDELFFDDSLPCEYSDSVIHGVNVRWVVAPGVNRQRVTLYFHGGGYKMGSVISHHDLMVRISAAANCQVLGIDYRLNPEHHFPAPIEDAMTVYRALLDPAFHDPVQDATHFTAPQIALAGDSAGGGIVGAVLLAIKNAGLPQPAAAVMLSAWLDMSLGGASYENRAKHDPIHQKFMLQAIAKQYLADVCEPTDPKASPLFGDLSGIAPVLLQVGDCEVGLDDSINFAEKARAAGVSVELSVWDHMIHVFQQFAASLPEGEQAITEIGQFLKTHFSKSHS